MPDELWTEVRDIVQETGIKTIPMEKKCKKAKWLSGETLQIAVKRREAKSKGEKERYKHLNAEFQRKARRDKKAFFSDQCQEIEENNSAGSRSSARGKGHEEGGSAYTKAGLSLRNPPGNSRASTPQNQSLPTFCCVVSPTLLTLWGAVPHYLSLEKKKKS